MSTIPSINIPVTIPLSADRLKELSNTPDLEFLVVTYVNSTLGGLSAHRHIPSIYLSHFSKTDIDEIMKITEGMTADIKNYLLTCPAADLGGYRYKSVWKGSPALTLTITREPPVSDDFWEDSIRDESDHADLIGSASETSGSRKSSSGAVER